MKLKLTIEYDGTHFHGWQRQPGVRTIQQTLEDALTVYVGSQLKKHRADTDTDTDTDPEIETLDLTVSGSGRTDSGVHARGQVAHCVWPDTVPVDCYRLLGALNGITPRDILIRGIEEVGQGFDARHTPHHKLYTYTLRLGTSKLGTMEGRAWLIRQQLDLQAMLECARYIRGTHDFQAFRASDCNAKTTERTVLASTFTRTAEDTLVYSIVGKGFLKQMVRLLVGTMVEVGRGRKTKEEFAELLAAPQGIDKCPPPKVFTAPAQGLTLEWVRYTP